MPRPAPVTSMTFAESAIRSAPLACRAMIGTAVTVVAKDDLTAGEIKLEGNFQKPGQCCTDLLPVLRSRKDQHEASAARAEQLPADRAGLPRRGVDAVEMVVRYHGAQAALELP